MSDKETMAEERAIAFLRQLRGGEFLRELDVKLRKCVAKSTSTGKVSSVKIAIKLRPDGVNLDEPFHIEHDISISVPSMPNGATILYPRENGTLDRNREGQTTIADLVDMDADESSRAKGISSAKA